MLKQVSPLEAQIAKGKEIYDKTCITCHMANGEGLGNTFPPLKASDYLNANE